MPSDALERRLAAILSADVAGYSRLMSEDEAGTIEALRGHRERMGELVRQHGGRVVDDVGDNLLAEFPSAADAVVAAVDVQRELGVRNRDVPEARRMQFRVGINLGDVMAEGERIYGDGVNIAARVQALAEPGGVAVSRAIFDQVDGKLELGFDDLGEHKVKNLPRPVHVYRLAGEGGAAATAQRTVPGFSGRPAIAVLPFANPSDDPDEEFFAQGLADDLIHRLSAWRSFPVIARSSSLAYREKQLPAKQIAEALGARYLVEGSVRKAGDRVRITVQLTDGTTGRQVWSERYDRALEDVFAVQDEISEAVVASLHPQLLMMERDRARHQNGSVDAWECSGRAWWHTDRNTAEDLAEGQRLFRRAIELDPDFVWPHYGLAVTHWSAIVNGWSEDPEADVAAALREAETAATLDPRDPYGQLALGLANSLAGRGDRVLEALDRALALNPSLPNAYLWKGITLATRGRSDEALAALERGMRLAPNSPEIPTFQWGVAAAHFAAGRYERAAEHARPAQQGHPDHPMTISLLAAAYALSGKLDEARSALDRLRAKSAGFSPEAVRRATAVATPDFTQRLMEGLAKAGGS